MPEHIDKPYLILCLDEVPAKQVLAKIPQEKFHIIIANSSRPSLSGPQSPPEADMDIAMQHLRGLAAQSASGFVITDENGNSTESGASMLAHIHRLAGCWHTMLLTGSEKTMYGGTADISLRWNEDGQNGVDFTDHVRDFLLARLRDDGSALPKGELTPSMRWRPQFLRFRLPDHEMRLALHIATALEAQIDQNPLPFKIQPKAWNSPTSRGFLMRQIAFEITHFLLGDLTKPCHKLTSAEGLGDLAAQARMALAAPPPHTTLQQELDTNPARANYHAVQEVAMREARGDEPPGATEGFVAYLSKHGHPIANPETAQKDKAFVRFPDNGETFRR